MVIRMADLKTCREHILSEDYRDFIGNHVRTPFFDSIMDENQCVQDAGFDYKCFYFPKETAEPVTLSKFSYNSIPKCFAPLSMETLNQTGILPQFLHSFEPLIFAIFLSYSPIVFSRDWIASQSSFASYSTSSPAL